MTEHILGKNPNYLLVTIYSIYIYIYIGLMSRVVANGPEDRDSYQRRKKGSLMPSC